MILNDASKIAMNEIKEIPEHYENIDIGENVVMPNHVHIVIYIHDQSGVRQAMTPTAQGGVYNMQPCRLQDIVGSYKSGVTRKVRKIKRLENFNWQRYYFDHIVRSERGLENISDYIRMNPAKWCEDIENELYFSGLNSSQRDKRAGNIYKKLLTI